MDFHGDRQRWPRRDEVYRIPGRFVASPDANSGHVKEKMGFSSTKSESSCFSGLSSLPLQRNTYRTTGRRSTEILVDEEMLTEREVCQNSPTVVEKLMGQEKLPSEHVFRKREMAFDKCLRKTPSVWSRKNQVAWTNSLWSSFSQHQEYGKVMDSKTAVMSSKGTSVGDISLLKPQSSIRRGNVGEVNWLVQPQQTKRHSTDLKPFNVNVLKDTESCPKISTCRNSEERCVSSSKRCNSRTMHRPSKHFTELNNKHRSLLVETAKSTVRNELPKRLKISDQHKEFQKKSSSSAGQMFVLSDKGTRSREFGSSVVLNIIDEKSVGTKESAAQVLSSTLSRKNDWKNGKFVDLPSPKLSPLLQGSSVVTQNNKQVVSEEQNYSIKDIINLRARNFSKRPVKFLQNYDKNETSSDEYMNFSSSSMDGMESEPQSPESCKADRQMSPVSVLDVQFKEDSTDCQLLIDAGFSEDEFMDDEERDYSYLLDMLIISGIHGVNQERLYSAGYVLKYPVENFVFEKLEKKYRQLASWTKPERKLFFNQINAVLGEILAPCMDSHPWVRRNQGLVPMWGSEGLVEKVSEMLVRENKKLSVGKAEEKVLDGIWFDLRDVVDEIGMQVEDKLLQELLEEFVSELIIRIS